MDQVRLKNFRCFRDEQTARLAPLTLLVGENSTGKTSFLALIRALWVMALVRATPDFKEAPYDLGSFDEIVHSRGRRTERVGNIEVGLVLGAGDSPCRFDAVIVREGSFPKVATWRLARGDVWVEERREGIVDRSIHFGTVNGEWKRSLPPMFPRAALGAEVLALSYQTAFYPMQVFAEFAPQNGSPSITEEDRRKFSNLLAGSGVEDVSPEDPGPFASAPVRSRPRRTYDPARPTRDPEGENVPMYISTAFSEDTKSWTRLKNALERFGQDAGLFDEISVKRLGNRGSDPFQIQVRTFGRRTKGPMRNLIDVGYGVSQVVPVITELFRDSETPVFLLQQPEVHLHPSAQAALGSLFCRIAAARRQLVIETHSDHLLDRVRMDVRDGRSKLKPEDVSILFFERGDLDVRIHSLRLDAEGNVQGAPPGYRRFFMDETRRSLKL